MSDEIWQIVAKFDEILKKFVNKKTGEDCDADSSMITIFPKEPYGVKDYSINVNLVPSGL